MKKGKLISKIFGIAVVLLVIASEIRNWKLKSYLFQKEKVGGFRAR